MNAFILTVAPYVSTLIVIATVLIHVWPKLTPKESGYDAWCRESRARDPNFVEPYTWVVKDGRWQQVHRSEVDPVYKAEYEAQAAKWKAEATITPPEQP